METALSRVAQMIAILVTHYYLVKCIYDSTVRLPIDFIHLIACSSVAENFEYHSPIWTAPEQRLCKH